MEKNRKSGPRMITSASAAINELGGTARVANMFGLSYRVISNWRVRGLPPDTYAALAPLLTQRRCHFSPLLFGQRMLAQSLIPVSELQPKNKGGRPPKQKGNACPTATATPPP